MLVCMYVCVLCAQSCLFVTSRTVAHQASLSTGFSRQEYWSGLPFPPLADLPDPGIESASLASPALPGKFFTPMLPGNPLDASFAGYRF